MLNKHKVYLYQIGLLAAALSLWEGLARADVIDEFFLPRPSSILKRLAEWLVKADIYRHFSITFSETLLAFAIGTVLGIGVGLRLALAPMALKVLDPYIKAFNAIPRIVLAPIFTLWFGLGMVSKVA